MKATESKTNWVKIGVLRRISFIGKDVLAFGHGCHLKFINLITQQVTIFTANSQELGDGINCFVGHRTQSIFAYAEKCTNPKVFVRFYPTFEPICIFCDGPENGYLDLAFSETSLLIGLSDFPNFELSVFNWRRGEKSATRDTDILSTKQVIRANLGNPVYVAQLGLNSTDLHLWDVFICGKKCVLTQHEIQVPENCDPFVGLYWTSEGTLLTIDVKGSVYAMNNYVLEKIIDFDCNMKGRTSMIWYKQGLLVGGPNNELRHYKKSGEWSMDWSVATDPLQTVLGRIDRMVIVTKYQDLFEFKFSRMEFEPVCKGATRFMNFCLVQPVSEYLVALCHHDLLEVYKVATGELMSSYRLEKTAMYMRANPRFPYMIIGTADGYVEFYSVYHPEKIVKMTEIHLYDQTINSLYFNECGTVFTAVNVDIGRIFIIEGLPGGQMEVIGTVNGGLQIIDYMMVISKNCYRIFVIPVTSDKFLAGNKIIRYCVVRNKKTDVKTYTFEDENIMYQRIYGTTKPNRDRTFLAVPYGHRTIHELEIKRGNLKAKLLRSIRSGHQLCHVKLRVKKSHTLTWAYDGFVFLRDIDFDNLLGIALPHHRFDGGVFTAYADPYAKYIISMGKDGILCCTDVQHNKQMDTELRDELQAILKSSTYRMLFSRQTQGFSPKGELEGKTWLEVQDYIKKEHERMVSKIAKDAIIKEFRSIQKELQDLLTANIEGPDNEKLELIEFNLDKKLYQTKADHQKKLRKATDVYLKNVIHEQNRICKDLLENFMEMMDNIGTVIKGIFEDFNVTNYVIRKNGSITGDELQYIQRYRQIESHLDNNRPFKVWVPTEPDKILQLTSGPPSYPKQDAQTTLIAEAIEEEEVEETVQVKNLESKICFSGSDLEKFIELENLHYLQSEVDTYFQAFLQLKLTKHDCHRLKEKFNKEFDSVMVQKSKDMNTVKDRNMKLRHMVSEINYFSVEKIEVRIDDPEWEQVEKPELLKIVKDDEVPITPYISPSEQAILDAKAAEAERIRLLLLADDFRERALMAMMNGVLEVRWEDELKKDVPIPKCMIEKEPEQFNEDDLRAVRDYEEKVVFLNSERERYKTLLNADYSKVSNLVREIIKKFNSRLGDLLSLKLNLDKCIMQEGLKIARAKLYYYEQTQLEKKEQEILQKIIDNDNVVTVVQHTLSTLHDSIQEVKSVVEGLQLKDKILEKAFKKDFGDCSVVVQEQVFKLYKKRPKANIRGLNSASTLTELAKCLMNSSYRPLTLNSDSMEYLNALNQMDLYVGIPSIVDEHVYSLLCKHRRLRIEYELRLKAAQIGVTEGEATISEFNRRMSKKKELAQTLVHDLQKVRTDMLTKKKDREIQIVLPSGLLERQTTGTLKDFEDAVMVCRKDIEDINQLILAAGKRKIKSLTNAMGFHRKIMFMEWQHKRFKMLIQDLEEKIFDIQNVRLTKEMQYYLKSKNKESSMPFETEVDMIKGSYENTIQDRKDIVNRMKKQIHAIRTEDKVLDEKITAMNVDVCELNLIKDHELDAKEKAIIEARMKVFLKRDKTVKQIQANHHEILVLQTELELLRLKTYPTLKYKIMDPL